MAATNDRLLAALAAALLLQAAPAAAQLEEWHIGQGGLDWASQAANQRGALGVDGALQPVRLAENENLVRLLQDSGQDFLNGQPIDFTEGGQPRAWSNDGLFDQIDGPLLLLDGDPTTSSKGIFKTARNQSGAAFFFDLGAPFPINRIRFFPETNDPDSAPNAFEILVNDGEDFNDINRPNYTELRRVEANRDSIIDLSFATTQGRFVQLRILSKGSFNLAEFEIYGEGFVPVASYLSELHSFGRPVNFGDLKLHATRLSTGSLEAADAPPTATLQMRTGTDDNPLAYFRRDRATGSQVEVTEAEYNNRLPRLALFRIDPETEEILEEVERADYLRLPPEERGPVRDFVRGDIRADVDGWSPWSRPLRIDSTGSLQLPVGLPSPREYLQFRLLFDGDADNTIRIDTLRVEYSPELVSDAVGEVALVAEPEPADGVLTVPTGVDTSFTYDIRTEFNAASLSGYRGIRIEALPAPRFEGLWMGDPLEPVEDLTVVERDSGFDVLFAPVTRASNQPLRVAFRMRLLEHNTPIEAWLLGDEGLPPHPVAAGNATDAVSTNVINAYTVDSEPLVEAAYSTRVVTPNGDGINDDAAIELTLSQFSGPVDLEIGIYDLGGRRVRALVDAARPAGIYPEAWDGRDDAGGLVPPGIYLVRIAAISDARTFEHTRTLGVAY